ncbi:TonB-dependent siderophore receptor [Shewanella marina]|uniref:TonB-dependent siderophore receptor n=1 Tax=Shewanella marina TaxID=487319 RepID=UPI00046F16AE|nr:TonB-dependent receptor [Shewanella marina]
MSFKLSCVGFAVCSALASVPAVAVAEDAGVETANIERISVMGSRFNDYKVGSAAGAMRGDIDLMDTPQSVTVIPDFVTDEQLARNLAEVLSNDSSVTAGSEKWNRQQFSIRGFALDSGNGFLVNGHQHWSHYVQPVETLQQVEVLKGPSSMLYGQSGPGGLVNMVTKKPTYDRIFDLGFDTDEYGSTRFQMDAAGSANEEGSVRYRTMLVKQDTTYWTEYQNGENKERDRLLTFLTLDFDLTDDVTLSVKYDNTSDKAGLDSGAWLYSSGDKIGQVIGEEGKIWELPWAFIDINVVNMGADLQWHINDDWQMKLGYNHQQYERQRFGSSPTYTETPENGYKVKPFDRHDDWQYKTAYVDFIGNFTTGSFEHQFLIGANMLDYYYQQQAQYTKDAVVVMPGQSINPNVNYQNATPKNPSEYHHYGFYIQDLITLTDSWKALAGVRYDEQKKDGAGNNAYAVSPKFGLIYEPTDFGSIYVNYSKSFTPKSSVVESKDKPDVNDGLNLKPEYGTQYEIGTKWELFDGGLLMTAAAFDINVENRVITREFDQPDENGHVQITSQEGEQNHKGFEMGAQGQLGDSWFVTSSMMYLNAKYKNDPTLDGKTPIDAPKWSANVWTRYEMTEELALNFGAVYVGERFADTGNTIVKDAFVRFDLGATYNWTYSDTEMSVRMNVKNLFDTDYLDGGSYKEVTIGEGRNIGLAFEAKF